MSNSCRQESLLLSLGGGAFYLHLKRSLSNSIPQGMKSIRREWKCGSPEEQSGWCFEQSSSESSSSKTGVAPSYCTVIPSLLLYPPPPFSIRTILSKKIEGWRGWAVVLLGKILEECRLHS
ncbi:hypothetical protein CDAR_60121 [Caerostris darwini]|uniref:Uncharacterized protein n=1 Tax=Caerostris darwini TaxID=1538125 RepID=A0AAV4QI40_9ARAC|nr:hypothetical protein CDAR_60121 [Caerostris darwini]